MIETLHIGNAPDDKLSVTLRGKVSDVIQVLTKGLSVEDLMRVAEAIDGELHKRQAKRQ